MYIPTTCTTEIAAEDVPSNASSLLPTAAKRFSCLDIVLIWTKCTVAYSAFVYTSKKGHISRTPSFDEL